jgi:hypothetical protein
VYLQHVPDEVPMSELEIYRQARLFFEESHAVEQVFKRLPPNCKIAVEFDGRFTGHLMYDGSSVRLAETPVRDADFELAMSSEALRRMSSNPPGSIGELLKEFFAQGLRRDVKWRVLVAPGTLVTKGYLKSLKDLGPLLQGEAAQTLLIHAGKALAAIEEIKSKFRSKS